MVLVCSFRQRSNIIYIGWIGWHLAFHTSVDYFYPLSHGLTLNLSYHVLRIPGNESEASNAFLSCQKLSLKLVRFISRLHSIIGFLLAAFHNRSYLYISLYPISRVGSLPLAEPIGGVSYLVGNGRLYRWCAPWHPLLPLRSRWPPSSSSSLGEAKLCTIETPQGLISGFRHQK